ncbi:MAG TPA: hypothetical protein VEZ55_11550 [Chitinophagaceae bacterium]|nr:hypothetical protein [Chitinophagaceae bacterium]
MEKILSSAIIILIAMSSCKKERDTSVGTQEPKMQHIQLMDAEVAQGGAKFFDLNNDGRRDFGFKTTLVGDPLLQRDRLLFEVFSGIGSFLLNNEHEETPPLRAGDEIGNIHLGFEWHEISTLVLTEKHMYNSGEIGWDGIWKTANHRYLAIRLKENNRVYFGWIELSFDKVGEKIILHRAALCREANREIKAGI